jgi:hypothetical protein
MSAGFGNPEMLKGPCSDLEHIYETDQSMEDANQYLKDHVSAELGEPGPSPGSGFMAPFCRNTFQVGYLR